MLKTDTSYRRNLHRILTDYIPQSVIEEGNAIAKKYPISKGITNKEKWKWKYGYNEEYDMVIISKDGTIGQILEINDLVIALPKQPDNIRFEGLTRDCRKWQRYKVPKELMFFDKLFKDEPNTEAKLNEIYKKHQKFIEDDIHRKFYGDWFMNDNEVIYITGYYYFFLQHYKLTDMRRYPDFRMPQRDYFIFIEACFADNRCLGSLLLKSRRSSFSTSSGSIDLCKAITYKNGFFPIVSKKDKDAQTLFTNHIVKPFLALPKHLQPQRTGEVMPKSELIFSAPKKKLTTNNKTNTGDDGLDTTIAFYSTTIDAYDGTQVTISINDEIGKLKGNLDINEYWEQAHKMCHIVGSLVVGKALCGSTANPPNKGGKNYERFYDSSKLSTRDKTGQTKTGLYAIFIPADFTTMGFFDEWGYPIYDTPSEPVINELGNIVSIGVKEYLDNQEAACGENLQKLNAQKRNNPRTDTDPFLDEEATNMYATTGMVNTINYLKTNRDNPELKQAVFRFDLFWEDKDKMIVGMTRTSKGRFVAVGNLPVPKEFRNTYKMKNNKRSPANGHLGAFGCDPYQADRTKYNNGSKQGFVGVTSDHYDLSDQQKNQTFLFYNHRPDTREEAEDDIIKAIIYFSMPILPEINKKSLVEKLYKMELRNYVLVNPIKNKKDLTPDEIKYGGMVSSNAGNSIPEQESALETYIHANFHEEIESAEALKSPFLELNEQAASYTRENRGSKDIVVAWQLACIAAKRKTKKEEKPVVEISHITDIENLFKFQEV